MVTFELGFVFIPIQGRESVVLELINPDVRIISAKIGGFPMWRVLVILSKTTHLSLRVRV